MKRISICLILGLLISGCVAMGVPPTSDPHQMLAYAYDMIHQERLSVAKDLIDSSMAIYTEMEDPDGLADANYAMATLYKSPKVDATVSGNSFEDYGKSLLYLEQAEELYKTANNYEGTIRCRLATGNIYTVRGDLDAACTEYDKASDYYYEMLLKSPGQQKRVKVPPGYDTFPDMLQAFRQKNNCR